MQSGSERGEKRLGNKLPAKASCWLALGIVLVLSFSGFGQGGQQGSSCSQCAVWNKRQTPFRIYGNAYYVGPHGLSSILVTSDAGHILMDGALEESAKQIAANIKSLGFRVEDIKLIVNTHVHFDHAGGIADLQRLSGARVVASKWSADVMTKTGIGRGDPQYGSAHPHPIPLLHAVSVLNDGDKFRVGSVEITAHLTPGHTPGGTSWTWKSCERDRCLNMVYADSMTAVSADGFKFSDNRDYPEAISDFEKSFAFLETVPCDILITTHPDASHLWDRVRGRKRGVTPDPLINSNACRQLAKEARDDLNERVASERKQ
jgi:metallo-beta-lactamase class B